MNNDFTLKVISIFFSCESLVFVGGGSLLFFLSTFLEWVHLFSQWCERISNRVRKDSLHVWCCKHHPSPSLSLFSWRSEISFSRRQIHQLFLLWVISSFKFRNAFSILKPNGQLFFFLILAFLGFVVSLLFINNSL